MIRIIKISLFLLLFSGYLNAHSKIPTSIVDTKDFFVVAVKMKDYKVVVDEITTQIHSIYYEKKSIEYKVEIRHCYFGNIRKKKITVRHILRNSILLKDADCGTFEPSSTGPYGLSNDSILMMNIWRFDGKYYTFENNYYDPVNLIREQNDLFINPYILQKKASVYSAIQPLTDIETLYNIIRLKPDNDRLQQLEQLKESSQNEVVKKKCILLLENNKEYGTDFGKPLSSSEQ